MIDNETLQRELIKLQDNNEEFQRELWNEMTQLKASFKSLEQQFTELRGYVFDTEKRLKKTTSDLYSELETKQDTKTKQFFSEIE